MSSGKMLIIYCLGSFESYWAGPISMLAVASGGSVLKGQDTERTFSAQVWGSQASLFLKWLEAL